MNKFYKNLEFLAENPSFITKKLNKMSKVLSSHIQGIKSVEKDIANDSQENLRKHVHALMITTAAIAEDVYVLNLISMVYLNSYSFGSDVQGSTVLIPGIVEESQDYDHMEVGEKSSEIIPIPGVEQQAVVKEIKEPNAVSKGNSVSDNTSVIKVEESISSVSEEAEPVVEVKKRRGRKKKNPE